MTNYRKPTIEDFLKKHENKTPPGVANKIKKLMTDHIVCIDAFGDYADNSYHDFLESIVLEGEVIEDYLQHKEIPYQVFCFGGIATNGAICKVIYWR